jgi:hypothetical protein
VYRGFLIGLFIATSGSDATHAQSWKQIAPILQVRARPGCAELPDGRILIFGGETKSDVLTECEIYDPNNDTWVTTGDLNIPRFWSATATLPDGRIFVAGGCTDIAGTSTNTCEIYNPSSGKWNPTSSMMRPRCSFTITTLPDSNLMIVGGIDSTNSDFSNLAEEFDVQSESFISFPQPTSFFYGYQAVLSSQLNGIFLGGGEFQSAFQPDGLSSVQLFDFSSWSWKQLPPLIEPVMGFNQLVQTRDGRIALLSGRSGFLNTTKNVQIFDPSTNSWSISASLPYGHDYGSSYIIQSDSILTVGGLYRYATTGAEVPSSWIDLKSGLTWPGPVPIIPRTSQATIMVISPDNPCTVTKIIYLFAGEDTAGNFTSVTECLSFRGIEPSPPIIHFDSSFSFVGSACYAIDTSFLIGVTGCLRTNALLDSIWLTGSNAFRVSDNRLLPRVIGAIDSIDLQYLSSSNGSDTAELHVRYDFGSGLKDTTIIIIGKGPSRYGVQPAQLHRESASAYYGQLDSLPLGVDLSSQINIDSLWPYITNIQADYTWDSSVVVYASYIQPTGWLISSINHTATSANIEIQNNFSSPTQPLDLGTALFRPSSSQLASSWVQLSSLILDVGGQAISLCVTDNEDNHWAVKTLGVQSGVAEVPAVSQDITVFPNPAGDELFVKNDDALPASIAIYDVIGREVLDASASALSTSSIGIESLSSGVYFLVCHLAGRTETKSVTKQ